MSHGTASMHRFLPALSLGTLLLSCGGTPKAPDPGTDYTLVVQSNQISTPAITGGGGRGLATIAWINCAPQPCVFGATDSRSTLIDRFLPP